MSDVSLPPLLRDKNHAAPSAFRPQSLLREAQRQKGAARVTVPAMQALCKLSSPQTRGLDLRGRTDGIPT